MNENLDLTKILEGFDTVKVVELPSDADEKLIGKHIDWTDEPVQIN